MLKIYNPGANEILWDMLTDTFCFTLDGYANLVKKDLSEITPRLNLVNTTTWTMPGGSKVITLGKDQFISLIIKDNCDLWLKKIHNRTTPFLRSIAGWKSEDCKLIPRNLPEPHWLEAYHLATVAGYSSSLAYRNQTMVTSHLVKYCLESQTPYAHRVGFDVYVFPGSIEVLDQVRLMMNSI